MQYNGSKFAGMEVSQYGIQVLLRSPEIKL